MQQQRQHRRAVLLNTNAYGDLIREIRGELGAKQEELAELIGVSREAVSRWEQGKLKTAPSPETLALLAKKSGHLVPEFLIALNYNLAPLVEDGATPVNERLAQLRAAALTDDEAELLSYYRRLPPNLRRVVLRQTRAAWPDSADP